MTESFLNMNGWTDYPNHLVTICFCILSQHLIFDLQNGYVPMPYLTNWTIFFISFFLSFFLFTYPKKNVCFFFSPCYYVVIIIHRIYDLTGKSWCIARGHWVSWAVRVWENWRGGVLAYHQGQGWHGCAKFSWGWAGLCNKKSLFWSSLIRIDSSCVKWLL